MEKMMQNMMKHYPMMIGMGFMLVVIALIVGAFNAANAAAYYAVDKAVRDASLELAQVRSGIESTVVWLPYFKFLGVGMILAGITMALGVIATGLQKMATEVLGKAPPKPRSAMLMRAWMMLGMLVILVGFIVSLGVAGTASSVFSNPIIAIDAAESGSAILAGLGSVHAAESWLEAFKFVGVGFLFMGIINGLASILYALNLQRQALPQVVQKQGAARSTAPAMAGD